MADMIKPNEDNAPMAAPTKFTRFMWMDYLGILRTKVVPQHCEREGVSVVRCGMALNLHGGLSTASACTPTGEVKLKLPDPSSSSMPFQLPWAPRHAALFADILDEETGEGWVHGGKEILRRAMRLLSEKNLRLLAGYELEFALLKWDATAKRYTPWPDVGCMVYGSTQMYDMAAGLLNEIYDTCSEMKVGVRMLHAENGRGQFEVVLEHTDAERAVEQCVMAKEAVRAVARRHGLKATFAPKWLGETMGNGGHVHLSLAGHFGVSSSGDALLADEATGLRVTETGRNFIAGLVNNLQWIMFPVNSSALSYQRVQPGYWTGAHQCYWINNKETPLRVAGDHSNVELKVGDCISNPFIGLAAAVVGGVQGIDTAAQLGAPCQGDPAQEAEHRGYALLPTGLPEAIGQFRKKAKEADEVWDAVFPAELVQDMTASREAEQGIALDELGDIMVKLF